LMRMSMSLLPSRKVSGIRFLDFPFRERWVVNV
jgi:hypothetical protein